MKIQKVRKTLEHRLKKLIGKIIFIILGYNPQKPTKCDIRIYVLTDANIGYIQTILPYYDSFMSEILLNLL
ncbi:piggyBac transposable element-derived protein 4-like [Vespula squamosa]|uniref:PiggyBac transposable element-derived protein 4-like n=1 Tax=Vespula squamosa TaxID=30214 RepID=A0ABD2BSI3_VESSQ